MSKLDIYPETIKFFIDVIKTFDNRLECEEEEIEQIFERICFLLDYENDKEFIEEFGNLCFLPFNEEKFNKFYRKYFEEV